MQQVSSVETINIDLGEERRVYNNISTELEGAVIFSKNAENLILCQEV